jgi:L-ascorbate metabolism protein UlaG (beta-lactamase superfamily)
MSLRRRFRSPFRALLALAAGALAAVTALTGMVTGAGEAMAAANCFPLVGLPDGPQYARGPGSGTMFARAPTNTPNASPFARVSLQQAQAAPPMPTLLSRDTVELSFLGHSSFLIRTPQNVTVVTDYNGVNRAPFAPDIVTMNHAHSSHYTDFVEPGVKHILRGWATPEAGYPRHNLMLRDLRVRNVATDIRDYSGGTEYAGNSIFIFEVGDLCLAHFGHLHHDLDADRLGRMGQIDVAMVPVDGSMTLPHEDMANAVGKVGPKMVVPMHAFGIYSLQRFTGLMQDRGYAVRRVDGPRFTVTRAVLKQKTVLVFPEHLF